MLKATAEKEQIPFTDVEGILVEEDEMEALSDRIDSLALDGAFQTARRNAKEVLQSHISKDAWIGMLLKKYEVVDSF